MEMDTATLTRLASVLAATAKANEALLSVLIATHPEPDVLQHVWQQSKPEWIDEAHEQAFAQHGTYMQTFLARLAGISGEIDGAATQFLRGG
ncbi:MULTISPECIES: hypothetical protein [Pseudomonadota]|uniref:Uncharacterized protein n=1 Tax=Stenotrophomonas maltophilia TaxID=40324 RepID=A0AA40YGF1_STEMA|nr:MULTISPECIES: hypothetical protein [Pseudomonadota]MBH1458073.1 hypothetical protein [Stenotrophomonas maltophilia]MBH1792011.1 hypothetical protein [Stenotrophomonas maltophilia]MBN5095730.1 hypothetical protein [Stenotrophomonas maltophilia]MBN5118396.1 hypothetical protein [Stenotrophomonas maltophilia]PJL16679.1 hypothetical protein B9Y71_14540 [Stenotrophomonas maltophilia]